MTGLKIKELTKKYDGKTVVDSLSLDIEKGMLLALLGVNGAGKTTTIKMLSCLIKPTAGDAELNGNSITNNTDKIKKIIAVSPQETAIAPNLSVYENLKLMAGIHGSTFKESADKADEMIKLFGMDEINNKRSKTLSGGWQRRLSIAMALISNPEILFLDEPTLGLDVLARRGLWKIIESLKGKISVILTTHYLEEAESLSDKIAVMRAGKLVACGTAEELIKISGAKNFEDAFVKIAGGEEL